MSFNVLGERPSSERRSLTNLLRRRSYSYSYSRSTIDVGEYFINGDHRIIVDPKNEYEKERRLNKLVKNRLSGLGFSPKTLKDKQRKFSRDLEIGGGRWAVDVRAVAAEVDAVAAEVELKLAVLNEFQFVLILPIFF